MAQPETGTAPKRDAASGNARRRRRRRSSKPKGDNVTRNVAAVRELVMKSVLAPVNAVLITRKHLEEVIEDAVKRGRMTRDDAQQMLQTLLQRSARQTDDFLSDLERLLGRGRTLEGASSDAAGKSTRQRPRRASTNLPIANYDELSAAAVQESLEGLTPAELRKVRDYERRHANRKTVLDPIARKLR
jgi:polyhydroxyalkanoate synthesis regulator phasin